MCTQIFTFSSWTKTAGVLHTYLTGVKINVCIEVETSMLFEIHKNGQQLITNTPKCDLQISSLYWWKAIDLFNKWKVPVLIAITWTELRHGDGYDREKNGFQFLVLLKSNVILDGSSYCWMLAQICKTRQITQLSIHAFEDSDREIIVRDSKYCSIMFCFFLKRIPPELQGFLTYLPISW